MSSADNPVEVYQLRLSLKGISPQIWRRVLVRNDSTLADLHYIIQILMGWSNYYLHQFLLYGRRFAVLRAGGADAEDARAMPLSALKLRVNARFLYEYSFFDWWQHEIRVEKRLALDARHTYPICVAGARVAPTEDCDGAVGFMQRQSHFSPGYIAIRLLEIYQFLERHGPDEDEIERCRAELEQLRYWMDRAQFDRNTVNQRLAWYADKDERWTEGLEVL